MLKKKICLVFLMLLFTPFAFAADTFREATVVDQITVLEMGQIQVRQAIRVLKNDIVISQKYHRHVLEPCQALTGQDIRVTAQAQAAWTPEVCKAWDEFKAAQTR